VKDIIEWITEGQTLNFLGFEQKLVPKVFILGQLFIRLFLNTREEGIRERHQKARGYKWQKPQGRQLGTFFGKVSYWRSYVYRTKGGGGYYPLDVDLGLMGDGFSMLVQSYAALIATKMSYAQATIVLSSEEHRGDSVGIGEAHRRVV